MMIAQVNACNNVLGQVHSWEGAQHEQKLHSVKDSRQVLNERHV